jgi:hypothetical protein
VASLKYQSSPFMCTIYTRLLVWSLLTDKNNPVASVYSHDTECMVCIAPCLCLLFQNPASHSF